MLLKLYIKNFAIIEELHQDWDNNLSIITGETGAGKSILIGAIELILGARVDHSSILNKNEKCIIEAQFNVAKSAAVNKTLAQNDYEIYDDLIIRREINPGGRSRAFINDTPAKLDDLTLVGQQLINLHRQFENYEFLLGGEQIAIVDDYLQLNEELSNYQRTYHELISAKKELNRLIEKAKKAKAEQDYLQYVFDEIEELQLSGNIIEDWDNKVQLLENAHQIKDDLISSANVLANSENAIIDTLQVITKGIKKYSSNAQELETIGNRLTSTIEELKDIAAEIEIQESNIGADAGELQILSEKLETANKLLLKHNAQTTEDLIGLREQFSEQLLTISNIDGETHKIQNNVTILEAKAKTEAEKMSKKRIKGIKKISNVVTTMLPDLGFTDARFEVEHSFTDMNSTGIDDINFKFDANNTGVLQPITKAISGGELSRVMLVLKSLLADTSDMPCLIFDEIDTGISGETALKVGKVLKKLAQKHQVISITHLPQIAVQAQQHLFVYKEANKESKTQQTHIKKLTAEERVDIIAEMLSGKKESSSAIKAAQDLLQSN